jgi:hypothetical protein
MKRLLIAVLSLVIFNIPAMADDDRPVSLDKMPKKAQEFIAKYFPGANIAIAKQERGVADKSYDVIFPNGDKVEFDKKGEWTNIDCEYSSVPSDVIPAAIHAYVNKNYPNAKVKQIEKKRKGYDVELTNGWDITFDKAFRVVDLDN